MDIVCGLCVEPWCADALRCSEMAIRKREALWGRLARRSRTALMMSSMTPGVGGDDTCPELLSSSSSSESEDSDKGIFGARSLPVLRHEASRAATKRQQTTSSSSESDDEAQATRPVTPKTPSRKRTREEEVLLVEHLRDAGDRASAHVREARRTSK